MCNYLNSNYLLVRNRMQKKSGYGFDWPFLNRAEKINLVVSIGLPLFLHQFFQFTYPERQREMAL